MNLSSPSSGFHPGDLVRPLPMTPEQVKAYGRQHLAHILRHSNHKPFNTDVGEYEKYARQAFGVLYLDEIYIVRQKPDYYTHYNITVLPNIVCLDKGCYPEEFLELVFTI